MTNFISRLSLRLILISLAISFLFNYTIKNVKTRHQLATDASKLYTIISEPIDYISTISIYLGRQIADNNKYEDLKFIDNLFKETVHLQGSSNNIISWAMFSWGDKKHRLSANTMQGVSKTFESLVDKNYTWRARYEPWSLQFSKPDYGTVSKTWILPAAVGVANSRDEFMGTVIVGINIKALLNRAEAVVRSGNAFIVANRDDFNQDEDKIIFSSSNSPKVSESYKAMVQMVDKYRDWFDQSGSMSTTLKAGRFKYSYYHMLDGYPMVIFVGFNRIEFWSDIFFSTVKSTILLIIFFVLMKELLDKKKS